MIIRWMGHSCFQLVTSGGTTIATDPFDPTVGYDRPTFTPDLVTISHDHYDHDCAQAFDGEFQIASRERETRLSDVRVIPFASYHDDVQGAKRGPNTIYVFEADGKRVAHLGDLGHMLTRSQITALGKLDALLIPVGGVYTINGTQAAQLALSVGARTTVAMHFMTPRLRFELMSPEFFERAMGKKAERMNEIDLSGELPELIIPTLPEAGAR